MMDMAKEVMRLRSGFPQQTIGQIQSGLEVARGQPLLKQFNDLSQINTPESRQQLLDLGKKMLSDPTYKDQWNSLNYLVKSLQSVIPAAGAGSSAILHSLFPSLILAGVKNPFRLTNPEQQSI